MLKASARNCNFIDSPKRMLLLMVKSNRLVDGPLTVPRPALPMTFATPVVVTVGLNWKHAVLKYCCRVWGALAFGSQRTFGLPPATRAGTKPSPAGSKAEVVGVNGIPV